MAEVLKAPQGGRANSAKHLPPLTNTPPAGTPSPGVDLRQVAVLTRADWQRLQDALHKPEREAEAAKRIEADRDAVRQRSEEIVKTWDNTLQRKYERKLEERDKRLAAQEENRKKLDAESDRLAAERRKELLSKARTLLYYQTDRVKKLHSALTLTEILKERDVQVELKQLKKANATDYDRAMLEHWAKVNEEALRKETEEAMRHMEIERDARAYQRAQIAENHRRAGVEVVERSKEAEESRKLQAQFEMEKSRLAGVEREERALLLEDYSRQIEDVRKMRQIEQLREEEEDEEARVFAAAKRKMMLLRHEKEKELTAEKQAQLERIKDRLSDQLSRLKNDEEERLTKAIFEAEAKFARDEQAKKERNTRLLQEMDQFRKKKAAELAADKAAEQASDVAQLQSRLAADNQHRTNELEKKRRARQAAQDINRYLSEQGALERQRRSDEHEAELERVRREERALDHEETEFQAYATELIDKARAGGRNVFPLVEAARAQPGIVGLGPTLPGRTSYSKSGEASSAAGSPEPDPAKEAALKLAERNKKRLGFSWN